MKALYRRYRPRSLEDVVGQTQVTEILSSSIKQNKISHAYLFIGPRGTGKTSVARIFAHEVNDFKYELEDDYVDIIEIDGASNRGIDSIRELREKAAISPTVGKYKIYIIDEVHMLTREAFNALLKTLEEPPRHVIFIMATTDAHKVPVTITSRAQTFNFKLADHDLMLGYLKNVAKKEGIPIEDDAVELIVRRGGGSFRDSLSLLDQASSLPAEKITKKILIDAFGLPDDEKIQNLIRSYDAGDTDGAVNTLKELLSGGTKPEVILLDLVSFLIESPKPGTLPLLKQLSDIRAPFIEAKLLLAITYNNISESIPNSDNQESRTPKPPTSTPSRPKPAPVSSSSITPPSIIDTKFDWNNYIEQVQNLNDAISSQLKKADYEFVQNTLHIYPKKKITHSILSKVHNLRVLQDAAGSSYKVQLHNIDERPKIIAKDELLTKISDIMGGEVTNDGGKNPF